MPSKQKKAGLLQSMPVQQGKWEHICTKIIIGLIENEGCSSNTFNSILAVVDHISSQRSSIARRILS
ncbi:hypothetical protein DASC09_031730 [Saccharomycopsis crataegensis]|uniref:Uncharacterized protein n=1 Tax=Saccharomycopsis crataegensis TaxID=43959 RepID=A0AAV5QNV8_9ASCO|nr:hypothetical protein DASC09_031730 [Saccharomycopsis crataegensis]